MKRYVFLVRPAGAIDFASSVGIQLAGDLGDLATELSRDLPDALPSGGEVGLIGPLDWPAVMQIHRFTVSQDGYIGEVGSSSIAWPGDPTGLPRGGKHALRTDPRDLRRPRLHLRQHESSADSLEEADRQSQERQQAPRCEIYRQQFPTPLLTRALRLVDFIERLQRSFHRNPLRWRAQYRALTAFRDDFNRKVDRELLFGTGDDEA